MGPEFNPIADMLYGKYRNPYDDPKRGTINDVEFDLDNADETGRVTFVQSEFL